MRATTGRVLSLAIPTVAAAVLQVVACAAPATNLGLRAATLEVESSQAALDAARRRFLPEATFEARYTRAEGGREIELPFAGLLNPVHGSLNQLLAASGRPAEFPQIEDRSFNLIRQREQDTRLTLRQPLSAPPTPAAVRVQRALLTENLRVNESLFRNGKITQDQVLREELTRQVQLEVQQALDRLSNTADSLRTAEARADAAQAGLRIAGRKRDEGAISQVELDYATAAGALPADLGVPQP